jgi:hypothetical protein
MTPPENPPSSPTERVGRSGTLSGQRRERRALRIGLGVSAVAHLLILALYPLLFGPTSPLPSPGAPEDPERLPEGVRVVAVIESIEPEPDSDRPLVPEPDVVPREQIPTPEQPADPGPDEERAEVSPTVPSVAERLRPRMADPRLWAPLDPEQLHLTDLERAELLLRGMIQNWNDSAAVAAALSGRALDWTFTDEEGRRWGLSPGRLHLGDFSIPLPFSFQVSPGQREEWERRQWELEDMARGTASAEIRDTWAERAREIRRRMEEERARRPGGG